VIYWEDIGRTLLLIGAIGSVIVFSYALIFIVLAMMGLIMLYF
jgi:hypothetical protein